MKRTVKISDLLEPLDSVPFQTYMSNALQVADILEYILEFTGPAEVVLTSFSISEEFLRRLFFIRQKGKIDSLRVVLDYKATNKTLILWPFIAQTIENCYLADNHSKILMVHNDRHKIAVVMSQNLTRGNRYESGAVTTDAKSFDRLYSCLQDVITRQSVPFHEIFARAVAAN